MLRRYQYWARTFYAESCRVSVGFERCRGPWHYKISVSRTVRSTTIAFSACCRRPSVGFHLTLEGWEDSQPIDVWLLVDLLDSILHPGLSTPLSKLPTSKSRPDVGRSDKHHRELHTDGCRIHARSPDYVWQAIRKL